MSQTSSVKDRIYRKLQEKFAPEVLEVIDESDKHIGHAGHNGRGESHFAIIIKSDHFRELNRVERHRMVNAVLHEELNTVIHALSIKALAGDG